MASIKNNNIRTHLNPTKRSTSNYIKIIDLENPAFGYAREQLWLKKLKDNSYQVCCIPYLIYDVCLDDVVSIADGHIRIVKKSKRFGFRVIVSPDKAEELMMILHKNNYTFEHEQDHSLIAVDALSIKYAKELSNLLSSLLNDKLIKEYETIRL